MIPFPSGMFGSLVSNPFDNALFGFSTWSPAYYTVNGSNVVTGLSNIGPTAFSSITLGTNAHSLVTDGAGKKWFSKSGTSLTSGNFSAEQRAALIAAGDIAIVISGQATANNTDTQSVGRGCGLQYNFGGEVVSYFKKETSSTTSRYDLDIYMQVVRSGTTINSGPKKGLATGFDDPNTNTIETPAYFSGDNVVLVAFLKSTGFTFWQGTSSVEMRVANYRNADGAASNPSAETAELASNFTPAYFNGIGALSGGQLCMAGDTADSRYDHVAVYPASLGNAYFAELVNLLLNNKP